jgi:hypothetical protein
MTGAARTRASEPLQTAPVTAPPPSASPTLDDLFRRTAARQPDALALVDPPNKPRVTGDAPLELTFAETDRAVSAIAAQFAESGLPPGSIIAVQMPNTVEFVVTVLAAIRAGLVVALLPQLWRQSELTDALNRTGARAIVGVGRIEIVDHAELALNAAAEAFSIRNVFGFGRDLPEGMAPLSIETGGAADMLPPAVLDARRPALVTFDMTQDGLRVVPRSHVHLISGGLGIVLESGLPANARMLSAMAPSSFGGFTASITTWLLNGGTLALHHPADLQVLERQLGDGGCDALVAPAPLALRLAETGAITGDSTIRHVIGLWRTPDRVAASEAWPVPGATLTDVYLFGEIGLFGACRAEDGLPAPIMPGPFGAPRGTPGAKTIGEIIVTPRATLALRGAMVPLAAYRPAQGARVLAEAAACDDADTGYAARIDRASGALAITAPPVGLVAVGGYRFLSHELEQWAARLSAGAMLTALPDQLNGFRLAGRASDNRRAREALGELGLNPLMVEAFRDRASGT